MPAEEMGQRFFTRERIRNRLLKRAAEVWGYAESEMDEFDPLVTLLIEACSVEFERIAAEVGKTQNRMLERLAQLMYPEVTMVRPAYGIMQAVSAEPHSTLHPEAQFMMKTPGNARNGTPAGFLYFSPAMETNLVNGRMRAMATCREFYSIEEGVQKIQLSTSARKNPQHEYSLWLGLELDTDIDTLDGISFFFNWLNDPEAETWYQYLPFAQWSVRGNAVKVATGYSAEKSASHPIDLLEYEFDSVKRMEEEVMDIFHRQFMTVKSSPSFEKIKLQREPYPALFEQWFNKTDLQDAKDPLVWVEIRFPTMVSPEALDNLICNINCFPVLNRKLNKLSYRLQSNLNIVPLDAEGSFLSVKEIVTSSGLGIKLVPFGNPYDLQAETYTLRYGVNRFNERNSYETLVNLLDLVREESSFFSSLGEDFLAQHIRELNQILARMESKVKLQNKHEAPFPFLAVRSGKEGSTVGVEFWTCMGEAANKVPMGTKLFPYQHSYVKSENLYLVTTTGGGRDNMSDADKLVHYKKALFTRNRIVTPEDLRTVVAAELGQSLKSVDIRKAFMKGTLPGEGFMRCVQVTITPVDDDETDEKEWEQKLLRLKILLEKQSANNLPYHLSLQKQLA